MIPNHMRLVVVLFSKEIVSIDRRVIIKIKKLIVVF